MGVYQYTLRKDTKTVEGMKIGRYAYAYKHSNRAYECKPYRQRVNITEAAGERAAEALPDLEYAIMGEWKHAVHPYDVAVIKLKKVVPSFADTIIPGEVVGYIYKVGRKFIFQKA